MPLRRYTGTMTKFDHGHGYGWMKIDGPFPEAFIHIKEFPPEIGVHKLGRGVRCEFYLENAPKGLKCIRANVI
jgi:cold shock CspA family protein